MKIKRAKGEQGRFLGSGLRFVGVRGRIWGKDYRQVRQVVMGFSIFDLLSNDNDLALARTICSAFKR